MGKVLAIIFSSVVMLTAYLCFDYYMKNPISIVSITSGLVGFLLAFGPSWDMWQSFFTQMFENKNKN